MFFIIILIMILIIIIFLDEYYNIYLNDIIYFFNQNLIRRKILNNNISINNLENLDKFSSDTKILIISYDNRKDLEYLKLHNKNIETYCDKWKNINYKFYDKSERNNYWSKMYLVYENLLTNNYDYVMWLDTDTMIVNQEIDLKKILNLYLSDIFIGTDDGYLLSDNFLNAGIFVIKNSPIGIKFIEDCISYYETSNCNNKNNSDLNGIYSYTCYEQGTINNLINNKYFNNTTILPKTILHNTLYCDNKTFLLHNFKDRYEIINDQKSIINCFKEINSKLDI